MFTGIVEEMGAVKAVARTPAGVRLTILAARIMDDLALGASVNVNGTCLTVVEKEAGAFTVDLSSETLAVTTFEGIAAGMPVNLERAMRLHERLGGHLVAGHVDGIGTVRDRRQDGNTLRLTIEAPKEVLRYCVQKGSVTVDGISLTINDVTDRSFSVAIIPHTATVTTLGLKQVGARVNLEADLIGKFVDRLMQERGQPSGNPAPAIDKDYLLKRGLI